MNYSKNGLEANENGYSGKEASVLLIIIIFVASLTFDIYISKPILSLALIASTILSIVITSWGIPRLKRLKFKQIIRLEGPKKHLEKCNIGLFV